MNRKKYLILSIFLITTFLIARKFPVHSGEFTSTSATLSNARLSFKSALQGAQTNGSSLVTIDTANFPSKSVLQLQNRDTVLINNSTYTVATTIDDANDNTFNLTAGLAADDLLDDAGVYASQSATLTVRLTTISALAGGDFRILVPAVDNTAASNDGFPDAGGFEFGKAGATQASITCPTQAGYGTFTGTSTAAQTSGVSMNGVYYHVFRCAYTGAGAVGTVFDGSSNPAFVINNLINPAPSGHTLGQADTYSIIVQQRSSGGTVIDQTSMKIGVVDAVKVSATIAPQITFTISGVAASTSVCGTSTSVTTTALTVPFGNLTVGYFRHAAQRLSVTTNAINGYSVTAAEDDQVGRGGNSCTGDGSASNTCIVDASVTSASHTASADWTNTEPTSYPGFGYSLSKVGVDAGLLLAFSYNESSRLFSVKQFADLSAGELAQPIFNKTTVTSGDQVDVCYRISPAGTNAAGDYENYLVYSASATF